MNATIARSTLADALKVVSPAINRAGGLPVLAGVRIDATPDAVTLTASNIDLTITTTIEPEPSVTADAGSVVVPGLLLAGIVGAMRGDLVVIDLTAADRVTVDSDGTNADLRTLDISSWPKGLSVEEATTAELDTTAVAVLAHAVRFASAEMGRGNLTGVHFGEEGITATDSYRALHHETKPLPVATVPAVAVQAVLKATAGPVMFTANERMASFEAGATTWTTSLLSGSYPVDGILRMMGVVDSTTLTIGREVLADSLARVSALGDSRTTLTPDGATLIVSAEAVDVGGISDIIDYEGDHDEPIMFEVSFLASVVAAVAEDEITLSIIDSVKQTVVRSERATMMVMPIRIGMS